MLEEEKQRYQVVEINQVEPETCSCGMTRRAFLQDPDKIASLHLVDICEQARTHYHKQTTEIYYVLEGIGQMELDGNTVDVGPGSTVLIKPGCRHRALGDLKILNVPIPAFDPSDEWFD